MSLLNCAPVAVGWPGVDLEREIENLLSNTNINHYLPYRQKIMWGVFI